MSKKDTTASTNPIKIIHYCWFGSKPLSKVAKKCIKSWKKYFPDYEIMLWNEENFDVNICPFVQQAYENQKWAFVADYARFWVLHEYGGIYMDTDMKVLKTFPKEILDNELFLGYEDKHLINAAIVGAKSRRNKHLHNLLKQYDEMPGFDVNLIWSYAIPIRTTDYLRQLDSKIIKDGVLLVDNSIYIYPRTFFYPINYDYSKKEYTKHTVAVHLYDASWVDRSEKRRVLLYRTLGSALAPLILFSVKVCSWVIRKSFRAIKKIKYIFLDKNKRIAEFEKNLKRHKADYIVLSHPEWLGVTNVAKDIFPQRIILTKEVPTKSEAKKIAAKIAESEQRLVIFNAFAKGWYTIAEYIKEYNPKIIIKVLWHGNDAQLTELYDYNSFLGILRLHDARIIDEIGFVKKSQEKFYRDKGYRTRFIYNSVILKNLEQYKSAEPHGEVKMGLYAAGAEGVTGFRKNTYNQIDAASMIEDATLDIVPLGSKTIEFAQRQGLSTTGVTGHIKREELYKRLAANDINLYASFVECAPILPLESLELGVPCITGDNHHYFEGTPLEEYLIVRKPDDVFDIAKQIRIALKNKNKIMKLYQDWRETNKKKADKSVKEFIG
jgi:hypothetical protein